MATITRHGKGWRAQVRRKGQKSLSATFPRKAQAELWAAQRESERINTRLGILPKHTLGEALKQFRENVPPQRRGGRREANRLKLLEDDPIAVRLLGDLNSAALAELRDRELARGVQGTTVRRLFSLLSSVFRQCREWGWLAHNPFLDFRRPKPKKGRQRGLRQEEIDRVVAALGYSGGPPANDSQQVAVALLLAVENAMRASELLGTLWPNVQPKIVHVPESKNGDARDVAQSPAARDLWECLRGLDPVRCFTVSDGTRDKLFRDARKRAKLSGFTFHDSRAEAISRLSKKLDILELTAMVGHRDPKSLMHYYRTSPEATADKL